MDKNIDFRTTKPQPYNGWAGHTMVIYHGTCVVCGRKLYGFDNDPMPDPRGAIDENHAFRALVAEEYDMVGPDVPMCFACENTYSKYHHGLRIAMGRWKEKGA